ncbi:MAG: hypothetical protein ACRESZ_07735, partial [Methylococcales bacterium]
AKCKDESYEVNYTNNLDETKLPTGTEEIFNFDPKRILSENKAFIQNHLIEKIDEMKKQINWVQMEVLERIYDELLENPGEIDDKSRQLINTFLSNQADQPSKDDALRNFRLATGEKIKRSLEDDGYKFLPGTWESIGVTN